MKKKIAAACMVVSLLGVSLAGCGNKELSNEYIKVTQYKGLEVEKVAATEVTDELVEQDIQNTLQGATTQKEVKRAIKEGDTANIDYSGKHKGKKFDGGTAEKTDLTIGSGGFIEGFEEQLVGMKKGDKETIKVTFPDPYSQNPDLSGEEVEFDIKINSVNENIVPELDDKFVADQGGESKTVDEYKKEVKKKLEDNYKDEAKTNLENEVWTALLDKSEVLKYPDGRVEEVQKQQKEQYETMAGYYGMEFKDFLSQMYGMEEEQFNEETLKAAQDSIKGQLAMELIMEKEKLKPSEDEYKEQYKDLAANYNFESVDAMLEQVTEEEVKKVVDQQITLAWLVDKSVQVEPKADEEDKNTEDSNAKDNTADDNNDKADEEKTDEEAK